MPDLLDILKFADDGDLEGAKKFLQWSSEKENKGATLSRPDPVVGRTALHKAAEAGHLEFVKWLLDQGVDYRTSDNSGETPLHLAAVNGHADVVKLLLHQDGSQSIILKKPNHAGECPIHWAARTGKTSAVEAMVNWAGKVALELQDAGGNRALHLAALNNHEKCTQYLLQVKADPLAKNNDGNTAMHLAARESSLASLLVLVVTQPLSDREYKNNKGETVTDLGRTATAKEILSSLDPKKLASKMQYANPETAESGRYQRRAADEQYGIAKRSFAGSRTSVDLDDY
eukprot:CAMPEP_0117657630 /NCGR_PEP_ID=MMETSP0804-20121206/5434_1 /TAXON_ID=1074897 /ORGANISM="Tetraselmis astigmatica, Strain CCMP880" /LENGTH=286 /DNA_ID=CAMNT_0005464099 /DNA_START=118 /DNA_END=978 /DNA_ORIENTATION=+